MTGSFASGAAAAARAPGIMRQHTANTLDIVAQRVMTQAKRNAPVLTGALRASGRVRRLNQFRRALEFGGAGTGVDYALAVEFGTFRTRPNPFLRKALMQNRKEIEKTMRRSITQVLNEVARQGSMGV